MLLNFACNLTNVNHGIQNLTICGQYDQNNGQKLQSGASSQAKIGGAYFSGVTGSIQDPIAVHHDIVWEQL